MSTTEHHTPNETPQELAKLRQQLDEAQTQLAAYEKRIQQLETEIAQKQTQTDAVNSRQQKIIETAQTLLDIQSAEELWPVLSMAVQQITNSDRVAAYLVDTAHNKLQIPYTAGISENYLQFIREHYQETPAYQANLLKTVIIDNVETDPRTAPLRAMMRREQIGAYAVLPFSAPDNSLDGVFVAYRDEARSFTPEEIKAGETLCHIGAFALRNIKLLQETKENLRRERQLNEITYTLSSVLDLPTILSSVVRLATRLIGADAGLLGLIVDEQFITYYPYNIPSHVNLRPSRNKKNIAWQIVEKQDSLVLADYAAYESANEKWVKVGLSTLAGAPVIAGDNCMGALILFNFWENYRQFAERDVAVLESIGRQAGIAIQNARMYAEAQQRANALAQMLNRQAELDELKNKFIHNVSHELRAPLGIIFGHVELLNQTLADDLQPEQRQSMEIILRRTRMLANLVEDLTALLAAQTQEFRRDNILAADLIYSMLADYQILAAEADITLRADIAPQLPMIQGDITHLRRVFDNLLSNAFKFTSAGGSVTIRVWAEGNDVIIEVTDTGSGIPADNLKYIFERFYQVEEKGRRHPGTGLGLALVKEIVEAHRGHVSVSSRIGQGTTFEIILPGVPPDESDA
ncbi:MAG TPA: GAF domain-containing protein [Anaerolineae bacterium]|nr:GAF domain-containing protein [Anaerolineae bacterium]